MLSKNEVEHKEEKVLGGILPGHPDIMPIIKSIEDKYKIADDDAEPLDMIGIVLTDKIIEWDAIREEVRIQVRARISELLPEATLKLYEALKKGDTEPRELQGRDDVPNDIRKTYLDAYKLLVKSIQAERISY